MKKAKLALAVSLALSGSLAQAETFIVNSTLSGIDANLGKMTFEEAMAAAHNAAGADVIEFDTTAGTTFQTGSDYYVSDSVAINGGGNVTLQDNSEGSTAFISLDNEGQTIDLTLQGLTLTSARTGSAGTHPEPEYS